MTHLRKIDSFIEQDYQIVCQIPSGSLNRFVTPSNQSGTKTFHHRETKQVNVPVFMTSACTITWKLDVEMSLISQNCIS